MLGEGPTCPFLSYLIQPVHQEKRQPSSECFVYAYTEADGLLVAHASVAWEIVKQFQYGTVGAVAELATAEEKRQPVTRWQGISHLHATVRKGIRHGETLE
jgi:hypothetical protein